MIKIGNTVVSDQLIEFKFICNLDKCKGACCVAGDAGAPLEEEEISLLEDFKDVILPFMTEGGQKAVLEIGVFDYDVFGEFVTPLVNGVECAFTNFERGVAYCAIERAYEEGIIQFQKPVSCHLYPVRITKYEHFTAVNYHKWQICKSALKLGKKEGVPLYVFLKEPLIRKFGVAWYENLSEMAAAENL